MNRNLSLDYKRLVGVDHWRPVHKPAVIVSQCEAVWTSIAPAAQLQP